MITQADQERIDNMVADYRRDLERLYQLAHTQREIDAAKDITRRLKAVK